MVLLKEDVPFLDLQKYSGSRFLLPKRSAVNPFRHFPHFQKGAFHELYPNFSKNQSYATTNSKSKERFFQDKFREGYALGQLSSENFDLLEYSRFTTKSGNDINFPPEEWT